MEWKILEHRNVVKIIHRLPVAVVKKYDVWKRLVSLNGPQVLKEFPGFHDEGLKGKRKGQRSSRLSLKYRVIYEIVETKILVTVEEITPHHY